MNAWRALIALPALACATNPPTPTLSTAPTEVAVRPEDFLGAVDCSANPGAMQSYVVTLHSFDTPTSPDSFTLPSTRATSCAADAGIQTLVIVGKLYGAEIDGYEAPPAQLTPFGGLSSGSRVMLDSRGDIVHPRWTARCGMSAATATVALTDQINYVGACEPIVDHGAGTTAVRLDPTLLLGPNPCSVAATVTVDTLSGGLPGATLKCDAAPLDVPATAGQGYRLYAHAQRLDGTAVGAECFAEGEPAETVTPACDALSSQGAAAIDPSNVVHAGKPVCPAGRFFHVLASGGQLDQLPLPCGTVARVGPLAPGITTFSIAVYDAGGQSTGQSASCAADVEPGRVATAVCL